MHKQSHSKQLSASSLSPYQKHSDTIYDDNEETALLGKIVFNIELDQQEEQGNEGDYGRVWNILCV